LLRRASALLFLVLAAATIAGAALAPSATADTILGSSLLDPQGGNVFGGEKVTVYQVAASGEELTAPADGTITSWSVRSGDMGAEYELRIVRPSAGGKFTAVGTSAPQPVPDSTDTARGPFAVGLPVKKGDRIALDVLKGLGAPIHLGPAAGELNLFGDPFGEGTTRAPELIPPLNAEQELLLQADFKPAPVNTAPPTISGEARAGTMLTASEGSWENAVSFAFQWVRCAEAMCVAIPGATSQTYTPTTPDEGQQLRVDVTATGEGGKTTVSSELTAGVKPAPAAAPTSTGPPLLSGEPRETETLSGTNGNWAGSPTRFEYQWLRCASATGTGCAPVAGATSNRYALVHADAGSTMRLLVTAWNAVGPTAEQSAPSAIVQPLRVRARFAVIPSPTCTAIPTELDASASQTPNLPITRYRFTYVEYPLLMESALGRHEGEDLEEALNALPVHVLVDGPNPRPTVEFTWNRKWTHEYDFGAEAEKSMSFVRDPIRLTLEVTDLAGATATFTQFLHFSSRDTQYSGEGHDFFEGREHCPRASRVAKLAKLLVASRTVFSGTSVASTIRCAILAPCAGTMSVFSARSLVAAVNGKAKPKRKPLVIAADPFFKIAGHHSAVIRAKLTAAGRALLKRGKTVKAVVQLTGVAPTGATSTHSFALTLRRK